MQRTRRVSSWRWIKRASSADVDRFALVGVGVRPDPRLIDNAIRRGALTAV